MKKLRMFVMLVLIVAAVATSTSVYATGMGWSETLYYDDANWTNLVGGRRVDGCSPGNGYNWGVTSAYKDVSSDTCDGFSYNCERYYQDGNMQWHYLQICP